MLLSLDISTSTIGIAIFDGNHKLHELSYVKFDKKEKCLFKKLDAFILYLDNKYKGIEFDDIAIEKSLVHFKSKFSSADVISKLTTMNALVSGFLYKRFNVLPIFYNVQTARSLAFPGIKFTKQEKSAKYIVWEAFIKIYPTINWEYSKRTHKLIDQTFDSVDAAVIGIAHIVSKIKAKSTTK